jgi:hypothetical protein
MYKSNLNFIIKIKYKHIYVPKYIYFFLKQIFSIVNIYKVVFSILKGIMKLIG